MLCVHLPIVLSLATPSEPWTATHSQASQPLMQRLPAALFGCVLRRAPARRFRSVRADLEQRARLGGNPSMRSRTRRSADRARRGSLRDDARGPLRRRDARRAPARPAASASPARFCRAAVRDARPDHAVTPPDRRRVRAARCQPSPLKEIRRLASRSIAVGGNPSRRSPRVLQRAQSLSHVMEFAERRLEPAGARRIRRVLLRIALAAAAQMHDEQNGDDAESGNQGGDHHG